MPGLSHDDLKKAFGSFAGKRVAVSKVTHFANGKPLPESYEPAMPKDAVLQGLEDLALRLGVEHRLVMPDSMLTMDYKPDRLNVHIVRDAKNDWYIGQIITDDQRVAASTLLQTTAADMAAQTRIAVRKPLALKRPTV